MATTTIKKVTSKEFKGIVDELIAKHGFQKAFSMLDQYEIVLPFQPEHNNEKLLKLINTFCDDAEKREGGKTLFTGSVRSMSGSDFAINLSDDFSYKSDWSDGYREVYFSEKSLASVTTCEGDLSVVLYDSQDSYERGFKEAAEFYEKY